MISILWVKQFKKVSPYLITEAIDLFKTIDLLIYQGRDEISGRKGENSWFIRSEKAKKAENNASLNLADLVSFNNIHVISVNKFLKISQ